MELTERNQYLAEEWRTALTQDERTDFNTRARTTQIIPRAEQIRAGKSWKFYAHIFIIREYKLLGLHIN